MADAAQNNERAVVNIPSPASFSDSPVPRPRAKRSRRWLVGAAAVTLLALSACSSNSGGQQAQTTPSSAPSLSSAAADSGDTRTITDVLGRTVEVPTKVERILMGGQRLLYTTALLNKNDPLEHIVAWPDDLEKNDPDTFNEYKAKFPAIDAITRTGEVYDGSMSLEQALQQRPQVFIVSAANFTAAQDAGLISGLEKADVPTVVVDYFTDPIKNTVPSIKIMGEITGHEQEAQAFIEYYESKVKMITDRLAQAQEPATPTFVWRAPGYFDCCSTFAKSNLAEIVTTAGGKNLGDEMIDANQGKVSAEALADKNPEVIIATGANWALGTTPVKPGTYVPLGYGESQEKAATDLQAVVDKQAVVKELDAVKEKRVYAAWHHFYDSPYNFLAIEWFAKAMHPDVFTDIDPHEDFVELHEKFLPVEAKGTFWTPLP